MMTIACRGLVLSWAMAGCFVAPPPPPCTVGWNPPQRLAELASDADEDGPWLSADRRHVMFSSNRDGAIGVYEAARSDAAVPFDPPTAVAELVVDLASPPDSYPVIEDPEPFMTEDLRQVYIGRRIRNGDRDIAVASRANAGAKFGTPSPAAFDTSSNDAGVDSSNNDMDPTFSPDLMTIYFASDRRTGQYRLYAATATSPGLGWGDAVLIDATPTLSSLDRAPAIGPDGTMLLFESDRLGGRTVFESDRIGPGLTDFGPPVAFQPLDGELAGAPYITSDGTALIYSADHGDGQGRDLYVMEHCD
jgi:hypothetical protein